MKIKRPLFIAALSMLVAIYIINTMPGNMLYVCPVLFLLFVIVHKFTVDKYTHHLILFGLAAIIAAGWLGVFKNNLDLKIKNITEKGNITASGTVTDVSNMGFANRFYIKLDSVDGEKITNFKVVMYSSDYFPKGTVLKLTGKYKSFTPKGNYIYSYSQGVFGTFQAEDITVCHNKTNYISLFNNISSVLKDRARRLFDYKTAPVAIAMGIGDKQLLDDSTVNAFSFTGMSHALVVSGLHVGFITTVLGLILYNIPVYKKLKNIVLMMSVFIFMGIIGFTPSIIRAGCLLIVATFGKTFIIETDNYIVLAVIVLITLIINPYSAHNGSLLLSYSAYLGVIQAADIANRYNLNKMLAMLIISVFATLYTAPVLCLLGMEMTFLAPFFNLLMTYVVMVICVLSFFLPALSLVPVIGMSVATLFAPVNDAMIKLLLWFTEFTKKYFSFAMINLSAEQTKVFILAAALAVVIGFIQLNDHKKRTIFILIVPIISVLCYNFMNRDVVTVKVFDGSSQPSYIVMSDDSTYLLATENINENRLQTVKDKLMIDKFDEILVCSLEEVDAEMYFSCTDSLKFADDSGRYYLGNCVVDVNCKNRQMFCIADIYGTTFAFNHNKADLSREGIDFYFFGSDTPKSVQADNYFYFYPVIKKNVDLVTEKQAKELYDILTIKIKMSTGRYSIVEDVKNFGGRL